MGTERARRQGEPSAAVRATTAATTASAAHAARSHQPRFTRVLFALLGGTEGAGSRPLRGSAGTGSHGSGRAATSWRGGTDGGMEGGFALLSRGSRPAAGAAAAAESAMQGEWRSPHMSLAWAAWPGPRTV